MEYRKFEFEGTEARVSVLPGARRIVHAIIRPSSPSVQFTSQRDAILNGIEQLRDIFGGISPMYMRWFLSDAANQASGIPAGNCGRGIIQQPPLEGEKVALWVIFKDNFESEEIAPGVWLGNSGELLTGDMPVAPGDSYTMTCRYLERLSELLNGLGATVADQCVRTWFMVRDVDVNYRGVVEGRNSVFRRLGLTSATHFIASTGINGVSEDSRATVAFNAYSDITLRPEQIHYLKGATHLNPTAEYGVAFERGTAVEYADRREVYISGTASINNRGEIIYPGDIEAQTLRMLENIGVLLREGGAEWSDVAHFIVYLRDIADHEIVGRIFRERFPATPVILLLAPVCRPGWLVEAECMAYCLNLTGSASLSTAPRI